ncbi:MAG: hypothetical protein UT36_C0004G0083 [Candidatus Peregrinibacteria bacterium GW2011_GWF2_39_17]|nr:MAG: hypothetical protein UT36_C0004G0083 [Candidatus Peregrinibacteria bacterium GW2011_GWF2_39_17]HCW32229.1 hypothetical protein [Candidatus Peregrinibacteria bacterium]
MRKSEFTPLQNLLTAVINQYNLKPQFDGATICHQFKKLTSGLWNQKADQNIKALSYKKGTLTIQAKSSGWAQQVQFKKTAILEQLSKTHPSITIKNIHIQINPGMSP